MEFTNFFKVAEEIATTNNGKLRLENLSKEERAEVPGLVEMGLLEYATFLFENDSIRLSSATLREIEEDLTFYP